MVKLTTTKNQKKLLYSSFKQATFGVLSILFLLNSHNTLTIEWIIKPSIFAYLNNKFPKICYVKHVFSILQCIFHMKYSLAFKGITVTFNSITFYSKRHSKEWVMRLSNKSSCRNIIYLLTPTMLKVAFLEKHTLRDITRLYESER